VQTLTYIHCTEYAFKKLFSILYLILCIIRRHIHNYILIHNMELKVEVVIKIYVYVYFKKKPLLLNIISIHVS